MSLRQYVKVGLPQQKLDTGVVEEKLRLKTEFGIVNVKWSSYNEMTLSEKREKTCKKRREDDHV